MHWSEWRETSSLHLCEEVDDNRNILTDSHCFSISPDLVSALTLQRDVMLPWKHLSAGSSFILAAWKLYLASYPVVCVFGIERRVPPLGEL